MSSSIDIKSILQNSLAFKEKLSIGEDAYKSLKIGKNLQILIDTLGFGGTAAGIAKTATFASIFGTKTGTLAWIGLGTAVTPLPIVALFTVGSTALFFGVMHRIRKYSANRVSNIPKFINTPLDLLAASMFDLVAPAVYKMSLIDGEAAQTELDLIHEYFVEDWGYSKDYVVKSSAIVMEDIQEKTLKDIFEPLVEFLRKNPDCNKREIANDLASILKEIAEADGEVKESEQKFLEEATEILCGKRIKFASIMPKLPKFRK